MRSRGTFVRAAAGARAPPRASSRWAAYPSLERGELQQPHGCRLEGSVRSLCTPLHLRKIKVAELKPLPKKKEKKIQGPEKKIQGPGVKKIQDADKTALGGNMPKPPKRPKNEAAARQRASLASVGFDFQKLGIGGLSTTLVPMFRRVFASRLAPVDVVKKMGVRHTKGVLLHGPPGTGKTLVARQIGKMLGSARKPKLVSGPELFGSLVGQSESSIRDLFTDAESEYRRSGDASAVHVIIFDEIDAVCKHRGASTVSGSASSRVHDNVVNQLLTKIDGLEQQNNVLVIGITNRIDLIDEAILRPGRLEVHIEFGLPAAEERLEILRIHTRGLRAERMLEVPPVPAGAELGAEGGFGSSGSGGSSSISSASTTDVAEAEAEAAFLRSLSGRMHEFSGAEVEATVLGAVSFALERITYGTYLHLDLEGGAGGGVGAGAGSVADKGAVDGTDLITEAILETADAENAGAGEQMRVTAGDFERSLGEVLSQKRQQERGHEQVQVGSDGESAVSAGADVSLCELSDSALTDLERQLFDEKVRRAVSLVTP